MASPAPKRAKPGSSSSPIIITSTADSFPAPISGSGPMSTAPPLPAAGSSSAPSSSPSSNPMVITPPSPTTTGTAMQDVPTSPDKLVKDEDVDMDDSDDTAWDFVEVDPPVAKSSSSSSSSSAPSAPRRTEYFWKLNPEVRLPSENFTAKKYALLSIKQDSPVLGKRKGDVPESQTYFVEWDLIGKYRQVPNDNNPMAWRFPSNLRALSSNGEESALQLPDWRGAASATSFYVNFFDEAFQAGQEVAKTMKMKDYPYWRKESRRWTDTAGTYEPGTAETRTLKELDGFGFTPKDVGTGPPSEDDLYVKLRHTMVKRSNGEGEDLIIYDGSARERKIQANGIYVAKTTIDQLRLGEYSWFAANNAVSIRTKTGQPTYINCPVDKSTHTTEFWQRAYQNGISKLEGKAVRSRNVNGLQLLFVIPEGKTRVAVEELEKLVAQVMKAAVIPIRQEVFKIVREEEAEAAEHKKMFSHYLATSPFGDYETWIKGSDLVSYLKAYPGYSPPADSAALNKAFSDLKPGPTALKNNKNFNEKLADQIKKLGIKEPANGIIKGLVSINTVKTAGAPGARADVPDQGDQMGGSATLIATALGWRSPADRIEGFDDTKKCGIKWDAPGVYPAEWLHRSAFSWGSTGGNLLSQTSENFIFGSSEANSLMTRYEKSWQRLFTIERSIQKARMPKSTTDFPNFRGFLTTTNTSPKVPIVDLSVLRDASVVTSTTYSKRTDTDKVIVVKCDLSTGAKTTKEEAGPDYWSWVLGGKDKPGNRNLSFSLGYKLQLEVESGLGQPFGLLKTTFFPFQRGFFTRIEAELDNALLKKWAETAISKLTVVSTSSSAGHILSTVPTTPSLKAQTSSTKLTPTAAKLVGGSSDKAYTLGSPIIVSSLPPSAMPHAAVWTAAINKKPVSVAGIDLNNPSVVTMDKNGNMVHVPVASLPQPGAAPAGKAQAFVAQAPLNAPVLPVQGTQAPTQPTTIDLSTSEDISVVPNGFILSGDVKLFGKFDGQMYSYYGAASNGLRQIVTIKSGTVKISDYIPKLAGSDFKAIQLQNTQFVYNELTTVTDAAGTWIQTDLIFSGPLQPISDVLKNVFHQQKPEIQVQALLSSRNDWSKPIQPSGFALRGSLPGISVKLGGILDVTELSLSINIGRHKEAWPPYADKWDFGYGFFGSIDLETPNDLAPMTLHFSLSEDDGVMTLLADAQDDTATTNFCGIEGLKLSDLTLLATFATGSSPSLLMFNASASLELRDTTLNLSGYYTGTNWGFHCAVTDFNFDSLRNMYEDLFGSQLHLSAHEVVFDNLAFIADPSGINISGNVTIEDHTSADATICISSLGVHITGEVDDVHLGGDIFLKQASLDVFIGRINDTTLQGPGTSFRFALNGIVTVANNDITASLYLDKDAKNNTVWTVVGTFTGAFSTAKIVPALKGSFLDLSLQEATFIASNSDGVAATGAVIPAAYPVIKGVQIAASLGTLACLDKGMGKDSKKDPPTAGMTLRAIYSADSSSFELAIQLAAPQKVSMKSGSVYSGPISLFVEFSTLPILLLNADFFVVVPNQPDPLKFSGSLSMNVEEAKLNIEMVNQWWNNPLGLSKELKLGPDLALQIGIVYEDFPIYPTEIGIAAGLAVGSITGKAALSISGAPNDELIMMEIDNLGVKDLVDFASTIFEHPLPPIPDFLRFKMVNFYLSTGTTIGTIVYPPGASFSCDAALFGTEATIYCAVDKNKKSIIVKGTLSPIDVGPLHISGVKPGTNAVLDVELGAEVQTVLINGAIRLFEIDAMIDVNASFTPKPTFNLKTELDFSTHLTFLLEATMRGGSFNSMASLKTLDFDIHAMFHQDILDYIVAQINMQILAGKHTVDDGIEKAQKTLDQAEAEFTQDINAAQAKVDAAKAKYDLKVAQATGTLAAEQKSSELTTQQLQASLTAANQAFSAAVADAERKLQAANENRTQAIRAAQQKVTDAKVSSDKEIDNHLRDLNNAKNDMQKRFGNTIDQLNSAQNTVNRAQSAADSAKRDLDSAKHDLAHCHWYEKAYKAARVAARGAEYAAVEAGLKTAEGALDAAKAVVSGPGYAAANASVDFYQKGVDAAKAAADASLKLANGTLQETINTQNAFVTQAENALKLVQTAGNELHLLDLAKKALQDFQTAENQTLGVLQTAVSDLAKCAEKVTFDAANVGLAVAKANVKDIQIAKAAVAAAGDSSDEIMKAGAWMVAHTANILNIRTIDVTADLRGLCQKGTELKAQIVGTFAEKDVNFSIDFFPGKGEEFVKAIFQKFLNDIKAGLHL